jgi:hypothetical protein
MIAPARRLFPVLVVAAAVAVAHAQTADRASPAPPRAAEFLDRLKQAVDRADRRTMATLVAYPLTVLASGFNIPVRDTAAFVKLYDSLFTPELRCAIVDAAVPVTGLAASPRTMTVTPDGLLIASGALWAPFKDGRYRIARIRVLPPAPSVEGRKGIERVAFSAATGERSAMFAGWLVRQNVDSFVVAVKRGETVQAKIEGFRGHDATVRITALPAGGASTPSGSAPDIGRTARVTASAALDYRVEVVSLAPFCDPPQRYKLTVGVTYVASSLSRCVDSRSGRGVGSGRRCADSR